MKRFFVLLTVIAMLFSIVGCNGNSKNLSEVKGGDSAMQTTEFDTGYVKIRAGLKNTYAKLKNEKKLTVAYLGGSITAGAGAEKPDEDSWRPLTTNWLKNQFPDAEITEISRGIGSTGSLLPAFYVDDYVIPSKPDLVFLEMAVNDYLENRTADEVSVQYETIIRKLLNANPYCEFVAVYTINDVLSAAEEYYTQAAAQNEVASWYGIPSANVGRKLKKEKGLLQPKLNGEYTAKWQTYFGDEVHPTSIGHKEYADTVAYLLKSAFSLAAEENATFDKKSLPKQKNGDLLLDTQFILAGDLDLSNSKGWKSAVNSSKSGLGITKYIYTDTPDNELVFTFTGANLYFYSSVIPFDDTASLYQISIDGGEWQQVGPSGANPITVVKGLKKGKHIARFRASGVGKNAKSESYNRYNLIGILVN